MAAWQNPWQVALAHFSSLSTPGGENCLTGTLPAGTGKGARQTPWNMESRCCHKARSERTASAGQRLLRAHGLLRGLRRAGKPVPSLSSSPEQGPSGRMEQGQMGQLARLCSPILLPALSALLVQQCPGSLEMSGYALLRRQILRHSVHRARSPFPWGQGKPPHGGKKRSQSCQNLVHDKTPGKGKSGHGLKQARAYRRAAPGQTDSLSEVSALAPAPNVIL